jgi:TRAP-type C4-dicarboxylate transport system substrate-binding protein
MRLKTPTVALIAALTVASVVDAETRIKIASMAPEGSFWINELEQAAETIEQRTSGRVNLRFYPGGTMGSDSAVLRKIRIGQLQGGVLLAGGLSQVDPEFNIYNLPLLFRSFDEVDFIRQKVDERLIAGLAAEGLIAFGLSETGFTYLMSSKPTRTFADLRGRKAWVPQGDPISLAIVDAAGLSPVPLPISDVLTGLQTGLIDTVAAPPVGAIALQWFTKAPYVTDLPITYVYGALVISERALESLSAGDRKILSDTLSQVVSALDHKVRTDEKEAREALIEQGVTFVDPTDDTRSEWDEIAARATNELLEEQDFDAGLYAEIERLLTEYRASQQRKAESGS